MAATRYGRSRTSRGRSQAFRTMLLFLLFVPLTLTSFLQGDASGGAGSETGLAIARDAETGGQRLIIAFNKAATPQQRDELHRGVGAVVRTRIPELDAEVVALPAQANVRATLNRYRSSPLVKYAEPDYVAEALLAPNDPYFPNQWHLARIKASQAWDTTTGSTPITVAIVDTGILQSHPDLSANIVSGYDFVNGDSDPSDDHGHGTKVAGAVGSVINNGVGVAGIAWQVKLMPIKVLGSDGRGAHSTIAQGITYATDRGARVINLSLGGTSYSSTLKAAVDYAAAKGTLVFAAAGNSSGPVMYPAAYDTAIAVSAIEKTDELASFSCYGPEIDLTAPGDYILTTTRSGYGHAAGTSLSCPIAAGVAALLWSANPTWSADQVLAHLKATADDLGEAGPDIYFGYGCVNAEAALRNSPASATRPLDTVSPVVEIVNPKDGVKVADTISINVEASDASGIEKVEIYAGGVLLASDTQAPYSATWDTRGVANGAQTILARAVDNAGNMGEHIVFVTVANDTRTRFDFKGTVSAKSGQTGLHTITVTTSGTLDATLTWSGKALLALEVYDPFGTRVAAVSGSSPLRLSTNIVVPGAYTFMVRSMSGRATYSLAVLAP